MNALKINNKIKKLKVSTDCVACGICSTRTNLLEEKPNGKVAVVEPGIVSDADCELIEDVIKECPVKAISIVDLGLVKSNGKEGLIELKDLIGDKIRNFKLEIDPKDYNFNKDEYAIPTAFGTGEYSYQYKSDDRAMREGLREFDRVMYSQRKAIIQQVLIEYKNKKLRKFSYYEAKEGNYYYDMNKSIEKFLKEVIQQIKILTNNRVSIPIGMGNFEVIPDIGIKGDKIDRELYMYQLRHIEELWFVNNIMNELEPLTWYDTFIDTDYMEDYKGRDIYCYKDIYKVCELFGGHMLNEFAYVLNGYDGVKSILEGPLNKYYEKVECELKKKLEIILKELNKEVNLN
ncbi:ferredoxin [Clostridium baratii]